MFFVFRSGIIIIVELSVTKRGTKQERLRTNNYHRDATVTQLKWNENGSRLFSGDNNGKVSVTYVPTAQVLLCSEKVGHAYNLSHFLFDIKMLIEYGM